MRWVYIAVAAALVAATLVFAVQNLQSVTVSFLSFRLSAPLAVLIAVIYVSRHGHRRRHLGADPLGRGRIEASGPTSLRPRRPVRGRADRSPARCQPDTLGSTRRSRATPPRCANSATKLWPVRRCIRHRAMRARGLYRRTVRGLVDRGATWELEN